MDYGKRVLNSVKTKNVNMNQVIRELRDLAILSLKLHDKTAKEREPYFKKYDEFVKKYQKDFPGINLSLFAPNELIERLPKLGNKVENSSGLFMTESYGGNPIKVDDVDAVNKLKIKLNKTIMDNKNYLKMADENLSKGKINEIQYKKLVDGYNQSISDAKDDIKGLDTAIKMFKSGNSKANKVGNDDLTPSQSELIKKFRSVIDERAVKSDKYIKFIIKEAEGDKKILPLLKKIINKYKAKGWEAVADDLKSPEIVKWADGNGFKTEGEFQYLMKQVQTNPFYTKVDELLNLAKSVLKDIQEQGKVGNTKICNKYFTKTDRKDGLDTTNPRVREKILKEHLYGDPNWVRLSRKKISWFSSNENPKGRSPHTLDDWYFGDDISNELGDGDEYERYYLKKANYNHDKAKQEIQADSQAMHRLVQKVQGLYRKGILDGNFFT